MSFFYILLFNFGRTLRHGMHDLRVWPGVEADGRSPTTTPGKTVSSEDQMNRLAKVSFMGFLGNFRPQEPQRTLARLIVDLLSLCCYLFSGIMRFLNQTHTNVLEMWEPRCFVKYYNSKQV